MKDRIEKLRDMSQRAELGGGTARIEKQHAAGKYTARERLDRLLDRGSFVELDKFVTHRCNDLGMGAEKIPGDGVVSGHDTIDWRQVLEVVQYLTVFGGSISD